MRGSVDDDAIGDRQIRPDVDYLRTATGDIEINRIERADVGIGLSNGPSQTSNASVIQCVGDGKGLRSRNELERPNVRTSVACIAQNVGGRRATARCIERRISRNNGVVGMSCDRIDRSSAYVVGPGDVVAIGCESGIAFKDVVTQARDVAGDILCVTAAAGVVGED